MKQAIKIKENELRQMISESVRRILREAENGGWTVEASEAQEAYNLAVEHMGEETINNAIIRCLDDDTLAECLAYIFREYDFREWQSRLE